MRIDRKILPNKKKIKFDLNLWLEYIQGWIWWNYLDVKETKKKKNSRNMTIFSKLFLQNFILEFLIFLINLAIYG